MVILYHYFTLSSLLAHNSIQAPAFLCFFATIFMYYRWLGFLCPSAGNTPFTDSSRIIGNSKVNYTNTLPLRLHAFRRTNVGVCIYIYVYIYVCLLMHTFPLWFFDFLSHVEQFSANVFTLYYLLLLWLLLPKQHYDVI